MFSKCVKIRQNNNRGNDMKSKTKYILAISIVGVICLSMILGLVAIVSSLRTSSSSSFKILYKAHNVYAKVSASYTIYEPEIFENDINITGVPTSWTTSTANGSDYINFDASDNAETVTKSFDGIDIELVRNQHFLFKYTFEHTGTETNSQKFLNIVHIQ